MRQRRVLFFVFFPHKRSLFDLYKAIIYFYTHLPISLPAGRTYVICRDFLKRPHHLTFLSKMPLFARVLESDLFAKHLPCQKPCKQRGFGRKSEVVRCFFDFPFFISNRVPTSIWMSSERYIIEVYKNMSMRSQLYIICPVTIGEWVLLMTPLHRQPYFI